MVLEFTSAHHSHEFYNINKHTGCIITSMIREIEFSLETDF